MQECADADLRCAAGLSTAREHATRTDLLRLGFDSASVRRTLRCAVLTGGRVPNQPLTVAATGGPGLCRLANLHAAPAQRLTALQDRTTLSSRH